MNFKLPNKNFNDEQLKMLEDIQLSQKNILENMVSWKVTYVWGKIKHI